MYSDKKVLKEIRVKLDHPATISELMELVRVPRQQRVQFRKHLESLVDQGALIKIRGSRYGVPERMRLITGRLQVNPRGFGFVAPDHAIEGVTGDLYIAGVNLNQAMHGDRVVARVEHQRGTDRAEGRIVRVIERSTTEVVGRYEIDESSLGFVVPFDRRLIMDIHIPIGEEREAKSGKMVVVEVTRWPTGNRDPVGRVKEVLGDVDGPGVDTRVIIRKYQLSDQHSIDVTAEASLLGSTIRPRDVRNRTDFRSLPTVTIDGELARDFDDAISLEILPNGNYWLGVHIADVAHYVPEGSALDRAAYERGTSVYFPERAVHMFPEELATGLCSLNPGIDRLAQSCLMEINGRGEIVRYEIHDGVINSDARMTYSKVNAILADRDQVARTRYSGLVSLVELMAELSVVLHKRRQQRGAIDFDLPASVFLMDDEGMVEAVVAAERNIAHRLVEEFMLVANETIAGHLEKQEVPALYRVHEAPDPLKIVQFEEFGAALGYSLGVTPDLVKPSHFQRLLGRLLGTSKERSIAFMMLRTMQQARYDQSSLGHFGLATSTYTHFTSPIRRYPDLVVHRALRESRARKPDKARRSKWAEEFSEVARHLSEMERRAEDAERELVQWKKVRFMSDKIGDEFTGHVTGVTAFGLFVELVEQFVEGLIHISSMADDYYRFVEREHLLRGENTGKQYRLGDLVRVQLVRVNQEQRQIELGLVEILEGVRRVEGRRPTRRQKRTRGSRVRRDAGIRGTGRQGRRR